MTDPAWWVWKNHDALVEENERLKVVCKDYCDLVDFSPTAEQINALPDGLRTYIHALETRCDPAGEVRELVVARDIIATLGVAAKESEIISEAGRELQKQLKIRTRELELSRENAEAWKVECIKARKATKMAQSLTADVVVCAKINTQLEREIRRLRAIAEHGRGRLKEAQKNPSPESVAMLMQHMTNQYQELLELGDDTIKDIIGLHRRPR